VDGRFLGNLGGQFPHQHRGMVDSTVFGGSMDPGTPSILMAYGTRMVIADRTKSKENVALGKLQVTGGTGAERNRQSLHPRLQCPNCNQERSGKAC